MVENRVGWFGEGRDKKGTLKGWGDMETVSAWLVWEKKRGSTRPEALCPITECLRVPTHVTQYKSRYQPFAYLFPKYVNLTVLPNH